MATLMGIALIILGLCVLVAPVLAGAVTVMLVGGFMAIAGLVECVHSFRTTGSLSRVIWLLVGIFTTLCGVLVTVHPILGLSFLTMLLVIYFLTDGLVKLFAAFNISIYRGWFICNGLFSFLLAYLIGANWPLSGGWAIGVLMGLNFIFTGVMALAIRKEQPTT
ncbi:MAG: DUF308 domain-containing protein [Candidatus Omnitrophota bacterium]